MNDIQLFAGAELKVLVEEDAERMFRLIDQNRMHLREWLPWIDSTREPANTRGFIEGTVRLKELNQGIHYGIWYEGSFAGTLGVHGINWANRNTTIGYWLGVQFQGRGLMTHAVYQYTNHLVFGKWNLNRVQIAAATDNVRSRAIPERLGFQMEGILRENEFVNERFVDHAIYGMVASDWRKLHSYQTDTN